MNCRSAKGVPWSTSPSEEDVLVPIRLHIDHETHKIRETFLWNVNEATVSTRIFAQIMCDDLDLPPACIPLISQSIDDQVAENAPFAGYYHTDRRVLIKLDILVGSELLTDQFEWEIRPENVPEHFAAGMCQDLGLGGEYEAKIAHAIREQVCQALRAEDKQITIPAIPRTYSQVFRIEDLDVWGPNLTLLDEDQLLARERADDREARRRRRARGPQAAPYIVPEKIEDKAVRGLKKAPILMPVTSYDPYESSFATDAPKIKIVSKAPTTPVEDRGKFTPEIAAYLKKWLRDLFQNDYKKAFPQVTIEDRAELSRTTGLNYAQVNGWVMNRKTNHRTGHLEAFLNSSA